VKLARVIDRDDRIQRDAADLPTARLLAIIRREALSRADQEAIAVAIDGANLSSASLGPDSVGGPTELSAAASRFLRRCLSWRAGGAGPTAFRDPGRR